MFTGIIENQAKTLDFSKNEKGARLVLEKPEGWKTGLGDSIAVQGACLTIAEQDEQSLSFDLMPESLKKTTFGSISFKRVNLERATTIERKLDGHIVSGHVDTIGQVDSIKDSSGEYVVRFSFNKSFAPLVIMKGSVTVDGVSLTVTDVGESWCEVSLIPYTLEHTTLSNLQTDDKVNLEFDMIGKYINRFMKTHYAGK